MITILNLKELKLLEMTKEFKDFTFQQNLREEYKKDKKVFKKTRLVDPQLNS